MSNGSLKIDLVANRAVAAAPSINLLFSFSNNTAQPISELHFQLAVTKVFFSASFLSVDKLLIMVKGYELKLNPQSGRSLAPKQSAGVTQAISVFHAGNQTEKVKAIKLRWRVSYKVGEETKAEMGEIPEFGIA